jgi:hypothetical protein
LSAILTFELVIDLILNYVIMCRGARIARCDEESLDAEPHDEESLESGNACNRDEEH